jgi:hypothetical protein
MPDPFLPPRNTATLRCRASYHCREAAFERYYIERVKRESAVVVGRRGRDAVGPELGGGHLREVRSRVMGILAKRTGKPHDELRAKSGLSRTCQTDPAESEGHP